MDILEIKNLWVTTYTKQMLPVPYHFGDEFFLHFYILVLYLKRLLCPCSKIFHPLQLLHLFDYILFKVYRIHHHHWFRFVIAHSSTLSPILSCPICRSCVLHFAVRKKDKHPYFFKIFN